MTKLEKVVRRRCLRTPAGIARPLVVSLEPGDVLGLRELGRRKTYRISLARLYWWLAVGEARAGRREGGRDAGTGHE